MISGIPAALACPGGNSDWCVHMQGLHFFDKDEQQNRDEYRRVAKILIKYLDSSCNFTPCSGQIKENSCLCNRDEFRQKKPYISGVLRFPFPGVYVFQLLNECMGINTGHW